MIRNDSNMEPKAVAIWGYSGVYRNFDALIERLPCSYGYMWPLSTCKRLWMSANILFALMIYPSWGVCVPVFFRKPGHQRTKRSCGKLCPFARQEKRQCALWNVLDHQPIISGSRWMVQEYGIYIIQYEQCDDPDPCDHLMEAVNLEVLQSVHPSSVKQENFHQMISQLISGC